MIFGRLNAVFQGGAISLCDTPWTMYKEAHVISQGKIPWNTLPWLGIEPEPQGDTSILPLSYHNLAHREDRQWATPLSYHNPAHREDRQWATPLSYHNPAHREDRRWATSLSYHDRVELQTKNRPYLPGSRWIIWVRVSVALLCVIHSCRCRLKRSWFRRPNGSHPSDDRTPSGHGLDVDKWRNLGKTNAVSLGVALWRNVSTK